MKTPFFRGFHRENALFGLYIGKNCQFSAIIAAYRQKTRLEWQIRSFIRSNLAPLIAIYVGNRISLLNYRYKPLSRPNGGASIEFEQKAPLAGRPAGGHF